MRILRCSFLAALCLAAGACAATTTGGAAGGAADGETFTANYSNIGSIGAAGATPVDIRITRWTTDAEQQRLLNALGTEGMEGFMRELGTMKQTGSIGAPQELAYPLTYARQSRTKEGGRHIVLATDRPMTFAERVGSSISRDYPLAWIELHLDAQNAGTGTMMNAVRLRLVGEILGIEDLSTQPAKLNDVRKVR